MFVGVILSFGASLALGAVVPQQDGLYKIANVASGRVMDHYRENSVSGDSVVTDTATLSEAQNWKINYLVFEGDVNFITLRGSGGADDDVHVGTGEGDGVVTQPDAEPTAFQLLKIPGADDPAYWLTLGGDTSLAVTGYNRRLQLTLETLNRTDARQIWQFYIPIVASGNSTAV